MRVALALIAGSLAALVAAAEPTYSVNLYLGGTLRVEKAATLQINLNCSGEASFQECTVVLELPEGLRPPGEAEPKRTFVLSGDGLRGGRLDVPITPSQAGQHTVSVAANWGGPQARAIATLLATDEEQGAYGLLMTATDSAGNAQQSLRAERLTLEQAAQLLGQATGIVFELDPTYGNARVSLHWSGRDEVQLAQALSNAHLTYSRTPDGKHILRPAVGESMSPPYEGSIRKNAEGRFYLSCHNADSIACLDLLFKTAGMTYEARDTLTAFPIRLEGGQEKSFEEALTQLCQQAGWEWTREEEKYVISLKK